ncbi:MAG: hypothetical protein NZ900_07795 [Synergistetes bacterium]|nr:hypothetical protein [Synergistota bacterium]MDW8192822.1 DUF6569 family protein [Synergistota bacterium]
MKYEKLRDFWNNLEVREPMFLRNVVIYPLQAPEEGFSREFLTLEDGGFSISELDAPNIDSVMFRSLSNTPFFILDGEELLGAQQDRVVNTSLWLEGAEAFEIPVSCIEQRRWGGGKVFSPGTTLLTPSLRKVLCEGVTRSLSEGKGYKSDQRSLWNSINKTLTTLKVSSKTFSFHDAYNNLKNEIESYIEEMKDLGEEISGFVIETPALIAVDLFGSRRILSRFLKKLLRSYLIEGFVGKGRVNLSVKRIKSFIKSTLISGFKDYFTPSSVSKEIRFGESSELLGKVLIVEESILHLSLFKEK